MTMKHQRDSNIMDSSTVLLGSDHSEKKRHRTISETSESSSIGNKSCNSNPAVNTNANENSNTNKTINNNSSFGNESCTNSGRMTALLFSLEAFDDIEQREIQQRWPLGSARAPQVTPFDPTTFTTQAAAALLQQKQQYPKMGQPLTARPAIRKIEEHLSVQVPASQDKANTLSTTSTANAERRDAPNPSPPVETMTIEPIKTNVTPATVASTFENAAFEQHRITGAAVMAAKRVAAFGRTPSIASTIIGSPNHLPLNAFLLPTIPSTTTTNPPTTKYHLNQGSRSLPIHKPTARKLAIHNAVHSDYKKIYKPLQRPPRLPTPHEALVVAAISTAPPTTSPNYFPFFVPATRSNAMTARLALNTHV